MPAARLQWFAWYPSDWFMSRTRAKLTPAERAAYFDILQLCYQSEDGCIEWDTDYLVSLTGVECEGIARVQRAFRQQSEGRWTHPRVEVEIGRIRRVSEKGREAAKRRWSKEKTCGRNATPMLSQHSTAQQNTAQTVGRSEIYPQGLDLGRGDENQNPVASDLKPRTETPPEGERRDPHFESLRAEFLAGQAEPNSGPRDRDAPWHTRNFTEHVRADATGGRLQRYLDRNGRTPQEPPAGWVNRTGKWERLATDRPSGNGG